MASTEGAAPESSTDPSTPTQSVQNDGLPSSFDVLIVGTGLTESIVSAAVSRNGHSVLHIDAREYYGGTWATFSLDQWTSSSFLATPGDATKDVELTLDDLKGRLKWGNHAESFEQVWYSSEEIKEELMKQKRRFNIDLMPKLVAAREDIVQLLITSNVSRYLEFLRIARLQTNLPPPNDTVIEPIPLSRSDIFTSKSLSLVEKRGLVKLIEAVMKPPKSDEEGTSDVGDGDKEPVAETFEDLVKQNKVSDKIKHLVKSSVAVLEDDLSSDTFNQEFCERCRLFLNSIGRYGNQTPFLWTLYGISEICQAFCRLSAVYGGIFILKRYLSEITSNEEGFTVKTDADEIKVKNIIFGPDMQCEISGHDKRKKEHALLQLGRSVLITKGGNIKPPDENTKTKGDGIYVYRISGLEVIEMNNNSQAVPKDYRLLQISYPILETTGSTLSVREYVEQQLSPFLEFEPVTSSDIPAEDVSNSDNSKGKETKENTKPQVIYGSYFKLNYVSDSINCEVFRSKDNTSGGYLMESAVASSDISKYVSKAKLIFSTLYPDEEFLPKAPDGEDAEESNGHDGEIEEPIPDPVPNEDAPAPNEQANPESMQEPSSPSENEQRSIDN